MLSLIEIRLIEKWRFEAQAHRDANSGGDGTEKGWTIAETLDRCAADLEAAQQIVDRTASTATTEVA